MKFELIALTTILIPIAIGIAGCAEEEKKTAAKKPIMYKDVKEDLMISNKEWFIQEQAEIDNYVARHEWDMITTGTGIRYIIYKQVDSLKNPKAVAGQVAVVNFEVRLLENDSLCYASNDSAEWFLIEMDNVESGLHEAIQYLRKGERAKIILPSYLAHGLMGDMDKIPPQASVLYDIELVDLKSKEEFNNK